MDQPTVDDLKQALPASLKGGVNQALIDRINKTLHEPEMYEIYRENLLSYTKVMQEGKFKLTSYIDAIKYVSHKLRGLTNLDAYSRTFPDKIQRFHAQGVAPKDIASYVTAYNKSKLVTLILEQTLTPMWILNQDLFQKALNTQAELMQTANSEKVRSDAANSILTHLKMPETQKVQLDVGVKEDSSIQALRDTTSRLAEQQRQMIAGGGMNAQEVAHQRLVIDGNAEEVKDDT